MKQVASRLRCMASAIDSSRSPVDGKLVSRDLRRVLAGMATGPYLKSFKEYLKDATSDERYPVTVSAEGYQGYLEGMGTQISVGYEVGPDELDFMELAGAVADTYTLEEHGHDEYHVYPTSSYPDSPPEDQHWE